MSDRPRTVLITLIFIVINSLIWFTLGVLVAADAHPALPDFPLLKGIMAFASLTIGVILLILSFYLYKRSRIAFYFALILLIAVALLGFFDQFGWIDLLVFAINLVPIVLLIKDRAWYLQVSPRTPGTD
jgi:lysylphosphatidylglycerol synthetase-like protein (DUF2156 family)